MRFYALIFCWGVFIGLLIQQPQLNTCHKQLEISLTQTDAALHEAQKLSDVVKIWEGNFERMRQLLIEKPKK